jgi:hypothetical protein
MPPHPEKATPTSQVTDTVNVFAPLALPDESAATQDTTVVP